LLSVVIIDPSVPFCFKRNSFFVGLGLMGSPWDHGGILRHSLLHRYDSSPLVHL